MSAKHFFGWALIFDGILLLTLSVEVFLILFFNDRALGFLLGLFSLTELTINGFYRGGLAFPLVTCLMEFLMCLQLYVGCRLVRSNKAI
ncbi:hypothetical protein N8348_00655 [Litorivicinus sp.]|nr:hypothetical protein [Litorivicinus sp.]